MRNKYAFNLSNHLLQLFKSVLWQVILLSYSGKKDISFNISDILFSISKLVYILFNILNKTSYVLYKISDMIYKIYILKIYILHKK